MLSEPRPGTDVNAARHSFAWPGACGGSSGSLGSKGCRQVRHPVGARSRASLCSAIRNGPRRYEEPTPAWSRASDGVAGRGAEAAPCRPPSCDRRLTVCPGEDGAGRSSQPAVRAKLSVDLHPMLHVEPAEPVDADGSTSSIRCGHRRICVIVERIAMDFTTARGIRRSWKGRASRRRWTAESPRFQQIAGVCPP